MLHFRPDLVRKDKVANFVPSSVRMENEFKFLRPTGLHAHRLDRAGHPSLGRRRRCLARHRREGQGRRRSFRRERFIELLRDVERFSLSRLA